MVKGELFLRKILTFPIFYTNRVAHKQRLLSK